MDPTRVIPILGYYMLQVINHNREFAGQWVNDSVGQTGQTWSVRMTNYLSAVRRQFITPTMTNGAYDPLNSLIRDTLTNDSLTMTH